MVTCEACGETDGLVSRNGVVECYSCYQNWFKSQGLSYIKSIKLIRACFGFSLRESKSLLDSIPRPLLPTFLARLPELNIPPVILVDGKKYRRDYDS